MTLLVTWIANALLNEWGREGGGLEKLPVVFKYYLRFSIEFKVHIEVVYFVSGCIITSPNHIHRCVFYHIRLCLHQRQYTTSTPLLCDPFYLKTRFLLPWVLQQCCNYIQSLWYIWYVFFLLHVQEESGLCAIWLYIWVDVVLSDHQLPHTVCVVEPLHMVDLCGFVWSWDWVWVNMLLLWPNRSVPHRTIVVAMVASSPLQRQYSLIPQ